MAIVMQPADVTEVDVPAPADAATGWRKYSELFILLGAGMITTLAFTAVVPGLQQIAAYFKRADSDSIFLAQFVVVAAPAGLAVGGLLAGLVVRTLGLRRALFLGLAISAVAGTCQLWVSSLQGLLASRFVLGLSLIGTDVALSTIIGARYAGPGRARLMGFRQAIGSIGTVSTMLLSGYLVKAYGWRMPGFMFLLPALFLLLALVTFNKPIIALEDKPDPSRVLERFKFFDLWPIYALALVMTICHAMPSFQMPFLLKEMNITDPVLISRIPALSAFIGILTALVFGFVYSKIGRMTFVLTCLAMGAGFIGMSLAPSYAVILPFVVLEGIGAGMTIPYFATRVLDRITAQQRAMTMGFVMTSVFLGHVLNPFVLKPIRAQLGVHGSFTVIGAFLVVSGVLLGIRAWMTRGKTTIV